MSVRWFCLRCDEVGNIELELAGRRCRPPRSVRQCGNSGLAQCHCLDYSPVTGLTKWPTGRMPTPYTSLARFSVAWPADRRICRQNKALSWRALSFLRGARVAAVAKKSVLASFPFPPLSCRIDQPRRSLAFRHAVEWPGADSAFASGLSRCVAVWPCRVCWRRGVPAGRAGRCRRSPVAADAARNARRAPAGKASAAASGP